MSQSFLVALIFCFSILPFAPIEASNSNPGVEVFYQIVSNASVVSDKVTTHSYQEMYGQFLIPYVRYKHKRAQTVRFFEIGLGCDGDKLYGGSVEIWHKIFKSSDSVWAADWRGDCIDKARAEGKMHNVQTVVGNQEDATVMEKWMNTTGGAFDIIVDDGGHFNNQIYQSLHHLWAHVIPGGMYFVEDTQVGRNPGFLVKETIVVFADLMKDWMEQLLINPKYAKFTHKILPMVKAIFCQNEACVILKCSPYDKGRCELERRQHGPAVASSDAAVVKVT